MENVPQLFTTIFSEDNSALLKKLLHLCADEICGFPGPSYHKFANDIELSKTEYETACKLILSILQNPACLYLSEEKMPPEFHELPAHVQQNILSCVKVRLEQLTIALLKNRSKRKWQTLMDFDWRLKLIMGSSKLASTREPLLQLDLITEHKNAREILDLELNKDELDTVINTLETIVSQ